jgi:hypothetical protein
LSFKLGSYSLFDLDEPRYPQAAREMLQNHDLVLPYFNGEFRFDKPVLYYWSQIISNQVFGEGEFAARMPSVIAAIALLALLYLFAHSRGLGLISCVILLSSIEFFILSRMSITDMLLNYCISGSLLVFFLVYDDKLKRKWLGVSASLLALGVLTKGPVALALPILIIGLFLLQQKKFFFKKSDLAFMVITFLVICLPWYVAAHIKSAGAFTQAFFWDHNIKRYTSVVSGHHSPWWFYLAGFIGGFMPWTIFLPTVFYLCFKNRKNLDSSVSFCLIWFISVIAFYNLSSTRLLNYILPCFTPLAFLTAYYIKEQQKLLPYAIGLVSIIALSYEVVYLSPLKNHIWSVPFIDFYLEKELLYFGMLFVLIIGIFYFIKKDQSFNRSFRYFTSMVILVLLTSIITVFVPLGAYLTGGIKKFCAKFPTQQKLYLIGIERPSVNYYCKTQAIRIPQKKLNQIVDKENQEFYIIVKKSSWQEVKSQAFDRLHIVSSDALYYFAKFDALPGQVGHKH